MRDKLTNYIRAGYPGLYLVTHEETRAKAEVKAAAQSTNHSLAAWSATSGLVDTGDGRTLGAEDPMEAVTAIAGLPDSTLVLLRDFHLFLQDSNPVLIRALKDALAHAKTTCKCIVIVGCRRVLPPELERECCADLVRRCVVSVMTSASVAIGMSDHLQPVLDSTTRTGSSQVPRPSARQGVGVVVFPHNPRFLSN